MRKLFMVVIAALLVVPAFAADGDTESDSTTLSVDIQSAVTVDVSAFSGTIVLDEAEAEGGTADTATATVTVRSNDEAVLTVSSANLAPVAGGEAVGGPSVAPGTVPSGTPINDGALYYNLQLTCSADADTWGVTNAGQTLDYADISAVTGVGILQGSNSTGTLTATVGTNSLKWEDAFAGAYDALVTVTLAADAN